MTSFVKRLKYYGFGFVLGLLFVIFFFQNRGCSWTPTNRVKTSIKERVIVIPDTEKSLLAKGKNIEKEIKKYLDEGAIDFNASEKRKDNKWYKINLENAPSLYFTLPKESFISAVYTKKPIEKELLKGDARMVVFPEIQDLIFMDTTDLLSCQMLGLGFKDERDLQKYIVKNALVKLDQSNFKDVIKPEHYLEFKSPKGSLVGVKTIWYKTKINISEFYYSDSLNCVK